MSLCDSKLNNLGLILKNATLMQNAVAAVTAASSPAPIVDHASVNEPGGKDYFFLPFACSSFVGKYSSTM